MAFNKSMTIDILKHDHLYFVNIFIYLFISSFSDIDCMLLILFLDYRLINNI